MYLHEYQAKQILQKYGVLIPPFAVVQNEQEAKEAIDAMGLEQGVVKVQVHAGGRGKAGGVQVGKSKEELLKKAKEMFGMKIVNNQTGKAGVVADKLLLSPLIAYKKEYYLSACIDRRLGEALLILSCAGGMEIEEVAEKSPDKIMKVPLPKDGRFRKYQFLNIAKFMGWSGDICAQGERMISSLAKAFIETDAELIEINPLVLTKGDELLALDAKMTIDDNALFRQSELEALQDFSQITLSEVRAKEHDLSYVALDGEIGCMVNGAGLAMATMDIIHHYGKKPANFLDVGGGATKEKVAEGFKILLADEKVKAILVNIFGGIMNCATIARGIVDAAKEVNVAIPLIVRLEGTNVEEGKKIIKESSLPILMTDSLAAAAQKAAEAARG